MLVTIWFGRGTKYFIVENLFQVEGGTQMLIKGGVLCGLECSRYKADNGVLAELNTKSQFETYFTDNGSRVTSIGNDWCSEGDYDDSNCSEESDWEEDEWPIEHPLPLPEWGRERPELKFISTDDYNKFLSLATSYLQQCLSTHSYDTFSNFVQFGMKYLSSPREYFNLCDFFRDYDPLIIPGRYTCVGLSFDLLSRLSQLETFYPGLKDSMYQTSVEEEKNGMENNFSTPPVKMCVIEHVMVCIKIRLSDRPGVILFDPGYHVAQAITVMEDGLAPHTGTIKGSTTTPDVTREYTYQYSLPNQSLVAWTVQEKRGGGIRREYLNVIHPSKPFLSSIDITERRNLVYPFKTLLGRDINGHLKCGFYFTVREASQTSITFFHRMDGLPQQKKVPLVYFLSDPSENTDCEVEAVIRSVAEGTGRSLEGLRGNLVAMAHLLNDGNFVKEILSLNEKIDIITL